MEGSPHTSSGVDESPTIVVDEEADRRFLRAIEAMIFAADEPVPPERLAEVYAEVSAQDEPAPARVAAAVEHVNARYEADGRPFRIEAWGGGYQMATHEAWAPFVKTLLAGPRQQSLSRSLSETLAVVAYRQPVTRPEVDFIRGVSADYAIRKLMELELVDVKGRSESLGRPLLYGTTEHFLQEFGLASLDDLPTLREVEELLDDPNFNKERAKLLQLRRQDEGLAEAAQEDEAEGREHERKAQGESPGEAEQAVPASQTDEARRPLDKSSSADGAIAPGDS